ncbi:MAG: pyrroline-5-carboxylate reductase [Anaerolineae bacterium]|nr:pyrroline-5-carboxylate reductase [Anaerolineae bacterium]
MGDENRIVFIGPGVMAEAMVIGLLRHDLAKPGDILLAGPRRERGEELSKQYGVSWIEDNGEAASEGDVVVLAVKPQSLKKALEDIKGKVKKGATLLSIVAGAPIAKIANGAGHAAVVRSMPNTPGQIGEGITVWTAQAVSEMQREMAGRILGALGETVYMEEETFLDKATALSGTGPAYVYLFMEAMVDAGVHLGFPRRVAEQLVVQTVRGSVDYYSHPESESHLSRLRNQVTSPGGTSAEALYYLEKAGFRTAISRAIWAAYERSVELGQDAETHPPSG